MNKKYTYDDLVNSLRSRNLEIVTRENEYQNTKQDIIVTNGKYFALVKAYNYIDESGKKEPLWFLSKNPFIIDNINRYLADHYDDSFTCISKPQDCYNRDALLSIRCNRCGDIIYKSLHNMRKTGISRNIITCPNCDDHYESLHAIVLKQIYKHYYPDSIEEDPSCINPNTNCVMKTDIVNHRLKVAIEIQGQFHNRDEQKERDKIKKQYWLDRGYTFYDYSIDNISVLEYVQFFFPDLNEIPDWINMDYNKKLNLKKIQQMLNCGVKVPQIANELHVNKHRIYDALHCNKIYYPELYKKGTNRAIVKLDTDFNIIQEYQSYTEAEIDNGLTKGAIADAVHKNRYKVRDYFWIPKDYYEKGDFKISHNI